MQNRNNQIVLFAAVAIAFLCAVPLRWFTLANTPSDTPLGIWPGSIAITGINGYITFLFQTPIWLLLVASAAATVIAATNLARLTTIPRLVPAGVLLLAGAHYLIPFFFTDARLSTSIGPVIGVVATAIALVALLSTTQDRRATREPNVA